MTYAEIKDGKIINCSAWETEPPVELGLVRVDNLDPEPQIEWDYNKATGKFTDNIPLPVIDD